MYIIILKIFLNFSSSINKDRQKILKNPLVSIKKYICPLIKKNFQFLFIFQILSWIYIFIMKVWMNILNKVDHNFIKIIILVIYGSKRYFSNTFMSSWSKTIYRLYSNLYFTHKVWIEKLLIVYEDKWASIQKMILGKIAASHKYFTLR